MNLKKIMVGGWVWGASVQAWACPACFNGIQGTDATGWTIAILGLLAVTGVTLAAIVRWVIRIERHKAEADDAAQRSRV